MSDGRAHPPYCDLVMKGGITSGLVYPLAVCALSKEYLFKNIGGASAGAIAAAATAAAEFGRRAGKVGSYERLAKLPNELGKDNCLLTLFQPDPVTKPIFETLLSVATASGNWRKGRAVARALISSMPRWVLALLLGWAAVPVILFSTFGGPGGVYLLLGTVWVLTGLSTILAYQPVQLAGRALAILPDNYFGLCSGLGSSESGAPAPLTPWLYRLLNELAGKDEARPLTFGDLWTAPLTSTDEVTTGRVINLEVMTTNLTHGRPYRIPFDHPRLFYFSPRQWRDLFPEPVVAWMEGKSDPSARKVYASDGAQLLQLPQMEDLPVIVAARMSLSFPLLISAVPLYAVDYTLKKHRSIPDDQPVEAERCWFSDGGICSNFPIHFFDNPLPRWPTFGIDLRSPHPDFMDKAKGDYVWLPSNNNAGSHESWDRFDAGSPGSRLTGFMTAIFTTMQNWHDNLQMRVPGYRDRVVHISIDKSEGGLNLGMSSATIEALSGRGEQAGRTLLSAFSWDNHVWVRYRSTMATLESFLGVFRDDYLTPLRADQLMWDVIKNRSTQNPPSYQWGSPEQTSFAAGATGDLVRLSEQWERTGQDFATGSPQPAPELRITPKV